MMHQISQQPVFVRGELDRIAVNGDAAGAGVEPYRSAIELALGVTRGAAQQRSHARQHLLNVEGFGNVIVGAGIESLNLVAPAIACRKDENRHGATGTAPSLEHGNAIHFREADVEDDSFVETTLTEKM